MLAAAREALEGFADPPELLAVTMLTSMYLTQTYAIGYERSPAEQVELLARQLREAQVEADTILGALKKAKVNAAWFGLSEAERLKIDKAQNELLTVYHSGTHAQIRGAIERLDNLSRKLAENMMNTAVRAALKGTKIG